MITYHCGGMVGIIIRQRSRIWVSFSFIAIILFGLMSLVSANQHTTAESASTNWSWTTPGPIVAESTDVEDAAGQSCIGVYRPVEIVEVGTKLACVQQGNGIKVATYSNGYVSMTLVGFTYDQKMYRVYGTGTCELKGGCLYSPDTDTFITKQHLINNVVRSLVIYKDFTKRLTKVTDALGQTVGYDFQSSAPDYTFKNADDYPWPVEGLGISSNGAWLAVEFRNKGIGILDMNSFVMKRITTMGPTHGYGYEPSIEFAITNNGQHVAMMGVNYGDISLYDIDAQCGDIATDTNMEVVLPVKPPCKKLALDTSPIIDQFFLASSPRFDAEGGELSLFAKSYTGKSRAITLRVVGYNPQRLDYLALGDSFSSGEGESEDQYYQINTNDTFEKCHLSKRSYPYLIAQSLGTDQSKVRSVACSGATTGDVVGEDRNYWGQGGRLGENQLSLNSSAKVVMQVDALQSFTPGRVHQISFVKQTRPKVITIGIGGNDVGFMEKLRACIGLDTCEWADTEKGREKTALEIQRAFNTLVDTYSALQNASPSSKIYVLGYPKVIDPQGECALIDGLLLNPTERTFMNEGIKYINQVIAAAAQKVGIKYIDIQDSFDARVLCGNSKPSVMNAVALGDDLSVSPKVNWLKLIGNESFHPRPEGHQLIASTLTTSVTNVFEYDHCSSALNRQTNRCPSPNVTAPPPSRYWLTDGSARQYESQYIGNFIRDSATSNNSRVKSIATSQRTFAAGSSVRIEIHSKPVTLATATADALGALSLSVELPNDLEEGFHTVHLYGVSYSGEQIDIYQVIPYLFPALGASQEVATSTQTDSAIDTTHPQKDNSQATVDSQVRHTGTISPDINAPSSVDSSRMPVTSGAQSEQASFDPVVTSFLIPSAAWLFLGASFALYARLRRGR